MSIEEQIEDLLGDFLKSMGYGVVRIQIRGLDRKVVEIMIDRQDGKPVSMDDCVRVSKESSVQLDVADLFDNPYVLEVTSPGINRPLVKKRDFERFVGENIKVKTYTAFDGRRHFQGKLQAVVDDSILMEVKDENQQLTPVTLLLEDIEKAKLIPN